MSQQKKILILISVFIVLAGVLTTPLADLGRFTSIYMGTPQAGDTIGINEMNAFLNTWSNLMQKDVAGYRSQQLSLSRYSAEEGLPPQLVRWLKREGWSAERFFYDEQKIRNLVNVASLEQNLAANKNLLSQKGMGGSMRANLEAIVEKQQEQLKTVKANPRELALIRANLYQISEILDGKAILKQ